MKNKYFQILIVVILIFFHIELQAQQQKGDVELSASLLGYTTFLGDLSQSEFNITGKAGYFFSDYISAGVSTFFTYSNINIGNYDNTVLYLPLGIYCSFSFLASTTLVPSASLQIFTITNFEKYIFHWMAGISLNTFVSKNVAVAFGSDFLLPFDRSGPPPSIIWQIGLSYYFK
jgi:hypothetical protein